MIVIYSPNIGPRLQYTVHELFTEMHGINVLLTDKQEDLQKGKKEDAKICYAEEPIEGSLHIRPQGLLSEKGIQAQQVKVKQTSDYPILYETQGDWKFDIFAASFFLMTRYEEYLPHQCDQHGRYKVEESTAYKNGFLELPLIDLWMKKLITTLQTKWEGTGADQRKYHHLYTVDVDNVFAYRWKGPFVNGWHLLKDLKAKKWETVKDRLLVLLRLREDPYFNLQEVANHYAKVKQDTIFFFHCGNYGPYDKKVWLPSLAYRSIRKKLSEDYGTGLHPSYQSAHLPQKINQEKKTLEHIIGKKVTQCRSHYLLFNMPGDYRNLEELGFTDDYSMAYSNNPGYRASTSLPYHFYDIEKDEQSTLKIHPLAVMDKTLHSNLKLSPDEASDYLNKMRDMVKNVNGEFVTLFHNENQTENPAFGWQGWQKVLIKNIEE